MSGESALVNCVAAARTHGRGSGAVVAVHGAYATVRRGDRIAVTGPSGSGKSTLLHLMAGLAVPTAGTVSWPAWPAGPVCRAGVVGLVFQGPSLLPDLDAAQNVALPLLLAGVPEAAALLRAGAALAGLGIGTLATKLPAQMSGGQAQRVAVARVLAARPALILADEPTGQLDRANADRVMSVLIETADELHAGLVVATHDEVAAARLDRRWQMAEGRLLLDHRSDRDPAVGAVPSPRPPVADHMVVDWRTG
jgi:ABC-type lipoprotein export system ATPase subunit